MSLQASVMDDIAHLIYLDEIKYASTMPNAFLKVQKHIDPDGYMLHPMLVEVLHMKRFTSDGTKDPHTHLDFFKEVYETFTLNAYSEDVLKYKLFFQSLTNESYQWLKDFVL
jgi:hypothetical protein